MNRVIGEVTNRLETVLHGDHHIITTIPLADGQSDVKMGMSAYLENGKYTVTAAANIAGKQPCAVLLEDAGSPTHGTMALAAVHGAIRADKLLLADGTPGTAALAAKLRLAGIYAIGDLPATAQAPVIDTQPAAVTVNVNEAATLSVIARSPDGGSLGYKWFKNATNSNSGGTAVDGGTNAVLNVDTATAGTTYYYCQVTNTLGSTAEQAVTNAAAVTVNAGG